MNWLGEKMKDLSLHLQSFGECKVKESLKKHTTFKVGGEALYYVYPKNVLALQQIVSLANKENFPLKVMGKGSNILASEDLYEGIIVNLDRFMNSYFFDEEDVFVEAGASLIFIAYEAMKHGLSGLEFASGIPGTIGGACFMNAGAYKSSMSEIIDRVWVLKEDKCEWLTCEECEFGYRSSIFQKNPNWIILGVCLHLKKTNMKDISELMDSRRARRMASQPLEFPSAGSIFQNPESQPAWKYIEDAGLRGHQIFGAMVSEKHANFIVNVGQAKAEDIVALIHLIQTSVKEKFGIELKTEVEMFNWKN